MARVMELFVIVNALCGIAAFLGVRFIFRRSTNAAKRGFDVITKNEEEEWKESDSSLKSLTPGERLPESRPRHL